MKLKILLYPIIVTIVLFSGVVYGSKDDERIDAVTEFLIERAKENYLYIFEQRLKDSDILKCYFPTIYSHVSEGDLRLLLLSRGTWRESIEGDMTTLVARSVTKEINKTVEFKQIAKDSIEKYLEIVPYLSIKYSDQEYPLNQIPISSSQELRDLINGFYDDINELYTVIQKVDEMLKERNIECKTPNVTIEDLKSAAEELKSAFEGLEKFKNHVEKKIKFISVNKEKIKSECKANPSLYICSIQNEIKEKWIPAVVEKLDNAAGKSIVAVAVLKKLSSDLGKVKKNTEKALIVIKFMRDYKIATESIKKYKKHLLFFAELSDAETSVEAKEILTAYTLPPVSFGVKREPHEAHYLITSYLGYGVGYAEETEAYGDDNYHGIYAPIGLEYSKGTKKSGSYNFMISPFDFGYPVSLKLNGVEQDVKLDDIIAPSVYISYGIPDYPLSIGFAFQRGRTSEITNETEERYMFVVAFDMPLLTLY